MNKRLLFIAEHFYTDLKVDEKIPYLTESNYETLKQNGFFTIQDMVINKEKIKKIINNKQFLMYLEYEPKLIPCPRKNLEKLVYYLNDFCYIVGSYARKENIIKDLDILVTIDNYNLLIEQLNNYGNIKDILKDGKKQKTLIYLLDSFGEDVIITIDLFIFDKITDENIINYTLSNYENKLYRGIAKSKGYKMNFDGLINISDNKKITYSTLEQLKSILGINGTH
jgi:DNA polymerase/3'-5' exonuclease PolX